MQRHLSRNFLGVDAELTLWELNEQNFFRFGKSGNNELLCVDLWGFGKCVYIHGVFGV